MVYLTAPCLTIGVAYKVSDADGSCQDKAQGHHKMFGIERAIPRSLFLPERASRVTPATMPTRFFTAFFRFLLSLVPRPGKIVLTFHNAVWVSGARVCSKLSRQGTRHKILASTKLRGTYSHISKLLDGVKFTHIL